MGKVLHFGIIGVGYFGKNYVRLLKEIDGVSLSAVARVSVGIDRDLPHLIPSNVRRQDPEELLSDPEIECVIIAAPTSFHFELAKKALEAGKHVLVEKPMTRTLEEARALKAAVERTGRIFMVGHQYLYNDYIRRLKNEIERGSLGKVRYIFAEHLYLRPAKDNIGCFWETATHELAIIDYLFSPKKVLELRGKMADFAGRGLDDFAAVWIDFDGAPPLYLTVSWLYPEKIRRMAIGGERGSAVFDENSEEKLKFFSLKIPSAPSFLKSETAGEPQVKLTKIEVREPLKNELEHFIGCVRERKRPLTDINHGVRIIEYLHTIYEKVSREA